MSGDALDRFVAVRAAGGGGRLAMATLVAAEGTSSSIVGAKTFVGAGGGIVGSVTIGGCIDARAVEAADRVLSTGRAELLDIALADEDAWDMGLGCGGTVRLLVEPVGGGAAPDPVDAAYATAGAAVREGRRALVVRALDGDGARLVIEDGGGAASGTLGDPARDARLAALAVRHLGAAPGIVRDPADDRAYFVEPFAPPPMVAIFGAGEVAVVLTRIAHDLGMRVVIVDARARYATAARFPEADEIRVGDVGAIAAGLPATADTFVVIVSHDYKFELPVLRHVLRAPVAYVGLMSSRKRGEALREVLAGEGFTAEETARIHTPIGVKIGARTPAQVAVAIAGELVAVRAAQGARV
jgi:xanthine dehydrogenase accessory factor